MTAEQLDIFAQKSTGKRPSLDELARKAKVWPPKSEQRLQVCYEIMKHHGGLAVRLRKEVNPDRIPIGGMYGFFWEAILKLPEKYNPSRGQAQTVLASICKSIAYKDVRDHYTKGSVRVPQRSTRSWSEVGINCDNDLHALDEIHHDFELDLSWTQEDYQCYINAKSVKGVKYGSSQSSARKANKVQARVL